LSRAVTVAPRVGCWPFTILEGHGAHHLVGNSRKDVGIIAGPAETTVALK
jgi:hypothetical protein